MIGSAWCSRRPSVAVLLPLGVPRDRPAHALQRHHGGVDDPDPRRRQLRLVRLHDRRLPRPARGRDGRACATTPCRRSTERDGFDGVLISPGPGTPRAAGQSMDVIADCAAAGLPMLGVCLGPPGARRGLRRDGDARPRAHARQDEPGGARRAPACSPASPTPFTATRYHSLAVVDGTVPDELVITARTETGPTAAGRDHGPAAPRRCRCTGCSSTPSPCSPRAGTGCWRTGSRCAGWPARSSAPPAWRRWCATTAHA